MLGPILKLSWRNLHRHCKSSILTTHFVPNWSGIVGAVVHLIVSAVVILLAGKAFSGVKVDGFSGAQLAAVMMALIGFGLALLLGGAAATVA